MDALNDYLLNTGFFGFEEVVERFLEPIGLVNEERFGGHSFV